MLISWKKQLIDMLMKYLYLHDVANWGAFAIEMYDFLYHSYSKINTPLFMDIGR